jgi:drug/metabolite transporter (DMT)-like permease
MTAAASDHRKGLFAVIIAALLWSTGGVFIKLIHFDAFSLSGIRSIFTLLTFIILFRKQNFLFNRMTFVAAVSYAAILVLFVAATKLTTAANAIFLQYTAPIYVLIFEPLLLGTKLRRINIATIIVCLIGMSLFFFGKISTDNWIGNFIALLSGISFAVFLLSMRKNEPRFQVSSIFWGNVIIVLICSPAVFQLRAAPLNDVLMTAYLGIFQIGIAYAIFSYGLKRVEAIEASLTSMIEPVLNPVWVLIWYGEQPSIYAVFGGLIILLMIGIRSVTVERKRQRV